MYSTRTYSETFSGDLLNYTLLLCDIVFSASFRFVYNDILVHLWSFGTLIEIVFFVNFHARIILRNI